MIKEELKSDCFPMKNLFTTDCDKQAPDKTVSTHPMRQTPEERDQGPTLVAIALLVFFAVISVLFVSAIRADELESSSPATEKRIVPPSDWKPPVAQKVELPPMVDEEQAKQIAEKWGVELISLNLSAANYMIDFRFRVLDEKKAAVFFDHRIKPYLHVEKSNAKLPVPMAAKVGAFRATNRGKNIKPNKIYYMVFGNPDAHVKSGEKVTMIIGDFKQEHLTVR